MSTASSALTAGITTGIPFMQLALARGHRITAFTRPSSVHKIPSELRQHPNLSSVHVELEQSDAIRAAIHRAKPDVVCTMLASVTAPYTAITLGNRAALNALRSIREAALKADQGASDLKPAPFIAITAWGLGPTRPLIHRWYERAFLFVAVAASKPIFHDLTTTATELAAADADGVIQAVQIMPPHLTEGARTDTYEWGDALTEMADKMHVFDSISRASMAHLVLRLAEKAVAGEAIAEHIAIRQP